MGGLLYESELALACGCRFRVPNAMPWLLDQALAICARHGTDLALAQADILAYNGMQENEPVDAKPNEDHQPTRGIDNPDTRDVTTTWPCQCAQIEHQNGDVTRRICALHYRSLKDAALTGEDLEYTIRRDGSLD
jgi:hypothetical protein